MSRLSLFSPAKINLFLAVTGKRKDDFHDLVSIVTPLDFGDEVEVVLSSSHSDIRLTANDPNLPLDRSNLAYAAAQAFCDRFGVSQGIEIHLEKRIPVGAGLGGGSGNAATVLLALAELHKLRDKTAILELAAGLGSDCPLFVDARPAIMRGRGEVLEPLPVHAGKQLQNARFALFKPVFSISTSWAYRSLSPALGDFMEPNQAERRIGDWLAGRSPISELLWNSFERSAFSKYPALPLLLDSIAAPTLMSGSGSCCFAVLGDRDPDLLRLEANEKWGKNHFFALAKPLLSR